METGYCWWRSYPGALASCTLAGTAPWYKHTRWLYHNVAVGYRGYRGKEHTHSKLGSDLVPDPPETVCQGRRCSTAERSDESVNVFLVLMEHRTDVIVKDVYSAL